MSNSNIIPGRDPQKWAIFNSEYRYLLSPIITWLCFVVVWLGSIHGLKEWLKNDSTEVSFALAALAAFLIQQLNSVAVHYSTRMVAAFCAWSATKINEHQRFGGTGVTIGIVCLLLTSGVCYFDYNSNKEGAETLVEKMVSPPQEESVDTKPHKEIIDIAKASLNAEIAAENTEKAEYFATVDRYINRQKRELEARRKQIAGKTWATAELNLIANRLTGLESARKDKKAAFVPKRSNVAGKQKEFATIAGKQSDLLSMKQAEVDTSNVKGKKAYEQKKSSRKGSMMIIYWVAMLLWHICHVFLHYRAFVFDEMHKEDSNPVLAIFQTIGQGISNLIWKLRAKIYDWMPEDEIQGITKTKLMTDMKSQICADVFGFILSNPGVKEMLLYVAMSKNKGYELADIRYALRLLKTGKMIFEKSEMWTADQNQQKFFEEAGFFFQMNPVNNRQNMHSYHQKSTNFDDISYRIMMLQNIMEVSPSDEIEYRIEMLQNLLSI